MNKDNCLTDGVLMEVGGGRSLFDSDKEIKTYVGYYPGSPSAYVQF